MENGLKCTDLKPLVTQPYVSLKEFLKKKAHMVQISDLSPYLQENVMRWIYRNEDKVWRNRGGRPGEETLETFTGLLTQKMEENMTLRAIFLVCRDTLFSWGIVILVAPVV